MNIGLKTVYYQEYAWHSLSAAIAAKKASGVSDIDAATAAKRYITKPLLLLTAYGLGMAMGELSLSIIILFFDPVIMGRQPLTWIGDEKIMNSLY